MTDEVVGFAGKVRKPCLSTETASILEQKADAKQPGRAAESRRLQGLYKAKADQEFCLNRIAEQVEEDVSPSQPFIACQEEESINSVPQSERLMAPPHALPWLNASCTIERTLRLRCCSKPFTWTS